MFHESRRELLKKIPAIFIPLFLIGCNENTTQPIKPLSQNTPILLDIPSPTKIAIPVSPNSLATPTLLPTQTISKSKTWEIQSIDSMKETKDRVENQRSDDFINRWLDAAVELGATHVAIDTPMTSPKGNQSIDYTRKWLQPLRGRGLKVNHRHPILSMEGDYGVHKDPNQDFVRIIDAYIRTNRDFFQDGDLFGIPEITNVGINGVNCSSNCIFSNKDLFNLFLQKYTIQTRQAFSDIGLSGVRVGGFEGYDGFIAAGLNNPNWQGKSFLDHQTVEIFGNIIAIDHYPKNIATMDSDLRVIQSIWPGRKLFIGECGMINGESPMEFRQCLEVFRQHTEIFGMNYWHMGMGGPESLLNEDFSKRPNFYELQAVYKGQR